MYGNTIIFGKLSDICPTGVYIIISYLIQVSLVWDTSNTLYTNGVRIIGWIIVKFDHYHNSTEEYRDSENLILL